jgi:hypothetical protein
MFLLARDLFCVKQYVNANEEEEEEEEKRRKRRLRALRQG